MPKTSTVDDTTGATLPAALEMQPAPPAPTAGGAPNAPHGELPADLPADLPASLSKLALTALRGGTPARGATPAAREAQSPQHDTAQGKHTEAATAASTLPLADPISHAASEHAGLQLRALEERADPRSELAATTPGHAAGPLTGLHTTGRPDAASPVGAAASLAVSTPVTSPEFREALGVQVSVLARNGVQQAQLQLNPADMGPISVQIAIEGTRAQVDFGADSFATRQIIESGLPELAAALRDAGFTLAGGGVSQHSRGRAEGDQPQPAPAGGGNDHGQDGSGQAGPAAARVNLRVPLGAVDLYA